MEINIKNAFRIAVKYSFRPCNKKYIIFAEKIDKSAYSVASHILKNPLFTAVSFSILVIFLMTTLSIILVIMTGVLILVLAILLVESFVALLFLVTVLNIIVVIGIVITIITIIGAEYKIKGPVYLGT